MSTTSSSREVDAGKLAVEGAVIVDEAESSWWDFGVENFGTKLWAEDDDGCFHHQGGAPVLGRRLGRARNEFISVARVRPDRRRVA